MGTGDGTGNDDIIMISTETIELKAGNLLDSCTSLKNAEKPVKAAGDSLSAINRAGGGCISKQLQDLFDAEASFFKNVGKLELGAYTLRNIGITYDNAEKTITGGETRELIWPDAEPSGSDVLPPKPDESGPEGGSGEKKSDNPEWTWNRREDLTKMEDADWYDVPFDYSHRIQIGQKKRINYPEDGSYKDQETFAKAIGINFLQRGKNKNPLEYTNPDTGKKDSHGLYSTDTKGSDPFAASKNGTIAEIYAEYACSWTLLGAQAYKSTEYSTGFAEAYVLRAQAKVHAGVGAYKYKKPDGTIVNAYGLSADAGASFTVAGAAASGDLGYNYAGLMGSASAVFMEAYAKGNVTFGMVGGEFYAVAQGSVGVDVAKATVSGGVRLLGMEYQGSATVKIGVSAKFEVGFEGGSFKANIGASLGLGIELSFSVDYSKVVSVIKDAAVAVVNGVSRVGRAIGRLFRRRW